MAHFVGNIEVASIDLAATVKNGALAVGREHGFLLAGTVAVAQTDWADALKGGVLAAGREHAFTLAGNVLVNVAYFKVT